MGKYYDNDVEFSSGLGRFIHMLTWPIRKFYIIIPVATLIYVTPIFFDVKPNEVHLWYKEKSIELYEKSMENEYVKISVEKVGSWYGTAKSWFTGETEEKTKSFSAPKRKLGAGKNEALVDLPKPRNIQRKAFDKASEIVPVEVVGLETVTYSDASQNVSNVEIVNSENANLTIGNLSDGNIKVSDLINPEKKFASLVYLQTTKEVKGEAKIMNANEVEINGVYILLYGVYVNPISVVAKDAEKYLTSKATNMSCHIVAYTVQNVATAVCFDGDENINQSLIRKNLTKNVGL
ncbi:MAG: hypothetical protein ACK5N8_07500 [Alphaproteobacteria bacterium]